MVLHSVVHVWNDGSKGTFTPPHTWPMAVWIVWLCLIDWFQRVSRIRHSSLNLPSESEFWQAFSPHIYLYIWAYTLYLINSIMNPDLCSPCSPSKGHSLNSVFNNVFLSMMGKILFNTQFELCLQSISLSYAMTLSIWWLCCFNSC